MQRDKIVEALMDLGLTYLQAKSYLALAQLDKAEARAIAKVSDVARQDIYRIMPTLEKLGLAERIVATPVLYRATPLNEGFKMLLQEKATEEKTLRKKVKGLLGNEQKGNAHVITDGTLSQFVIISEKKLLLKKLQSSFIKAETCDFAFPGFTWNFTIFNFGEYIRIALAKRAKIRVATEWRSLSPLANKKLETLMKSPFFQIRYVRSSLDFGMMIFDNKEVNVCVSNEKSPVPSLWTNNPQLLKMAQTTFEYHWNNARDFDDIQLKIT